MLWVVLSVAAGIVTYAAAQEGWLGWRWRGRLRPTVLALAVALLGVVSLPTFVLSVHTHGWILTCAIIATVCVIGYSIANTLRYRYPIVTALSTIAVATLALHPPAQRYVGIVIVGVAASHWFRRRRYRF